MSIDTLDTARLHLRAWQDSDLSAFAALNADPRVMHYFPSTLSAAASHRQAATLRHVMQRVGWGLWAVELKAVTPFIGVVGLNPIGDDLPIAPGVEIGWRLAANYWHQGYASEAARAVLAYAFQRLSLPEVVSFTAVINQPSRRLMARIGMHYHGERFAHPRLPAGHPLRDHAVYRLTRQQWQEQTC